MKKCMLPIGPCESRDPISLPPPWVEKARWEVNEEADQIQTQVEALRKLVVAEDGLFARTDDTFMLAFLRARKYNVNEAFKVLKNFYKLKKQYPEFTEDSLPSEKAFLYDMNGFTILSEKDHEDRVVVAIRVENVDLSVARTEHFFQQLWTLVTLAVEDPLVQVTGIAIVVDLAGFSLRHASIVTPSFARLAMRFVQDSFPVRIKGIHIVNEPFYFDAIFALFKPFLKYKLRSRIHLHGGSLPSLHSMVPTNILPPQLGGCADWNFAAYRNGVARNETIIKEWRQYGYDKKQDVDSKSKSSSR